MEYVVTKRVLHVLVIVLAIALLLPAAASASDDNIPGTAIAIGQLVSGTVDDATDPNDVYAIPLVSGEQVEVVLTDSDAGYYRGCDVDLLGPRSTSIRESSLYQWLGSADTTFNQEGHLVYTPARTGVYYIRVSTSDTGMPYQLRVDRTLMPAITTPDFDDIFGLAVGLGSLNGVVDDATDPNDVYAVKLFADEPVTIVLADADPGYYNGCDVDLLAPKSTSVRSSSTYTWLADTDTTFNQEGRIDYTAAADGTYYLWVHTGDHGMPYTLTISGSAEVPPYPSYLRLRTSAAKVRKGRYVTLTAKLVDQSSTLIGGKSVVLYKSLNGTSWTKVTTLASDDGRYSKRVRIWRKTWFRMRFAGDSGWSKCVSRKVVVSLL